MKSADRPRFMRCLLACAEVFAKDVGEGAAAVWWRALERYPIEMVEAGVAAHIADGDRGRFMPKPADIIAQVESMDGRPGAEEAWAMIPRDEQSSVVWTEEMAQAFGVCCDLIEHDRVAARMAFKDAYEQAVKKARAEAIPAKWTPSLGRDPSLRAAALESAVQKNRMSAAHAAALLPAPEASPNLIVLADAMAAGMIGGPT